jgi:hypothetical protein
MRFIHTKPAALALTIAAMLGACKISAHAQASAIPSAQPGPQALGNDRAHTLLDQMIQALGGDAWLNRTTWVLYGQTSHFYKGQPDPYVNGFEEYYRAQPFAERIVGVSHFSTIPGMPGRNHRDVASVWTEDNGYEVTYKGKKELPHEDVTEFFLLRRHSIDVVIKNWLKQPGVTMTYDGTEMMERRLADQLTITTTTDDSVILKLDESSHLPLSITFRARNETYKDYDTYTVEYEDYHAFQGIMTPMTVTRYKNGEMAAQRFLTKAAYNLTFPTDFFSPDNPAVPKAK